MFEQLNVINKTYPFGQDILHTIHFGLQFWLIFSLLYLTSEVILILNYMFV